MPPVARTRIPRSLVDTLEHALRTGEPALSAVADGEPRDARDRFLTLQVIHDLHVGDIDRVGPAVQWQHHPAVAAVKTRLEGEVLAELDAMIEGDPTEGDGDAVAAMRAIARRDLVPPVYEWVATDASWDELVSFLALEGGPDAGFDDLVAACQIGLRGEPKLELARNYWDEMGQGHASGMHGPLLGKLADALDLHEGDEIVWESLALGNLMLAFASNRRYVWQSVGALGAIELTAPGRAECVNKGLRRLGIAGDIRRYFALHATLDVKHSIAWNREALMPLVAEDPRRARAIAEGALMRLEAGARCFVRYRSVLLAADRSSNALPRESHAV